MAGRRRRVGQALWLALVVATAGMGVRPTPPAAASWLPPGVDLTRPRILFRAADLPVIQARLDREPYATLLREVVRRSRDADGVALDDHAIGSERLKARAAKSLAFLYAIDRTLAAGQVRPFATVADRRAVGQRAHELLAAMYNRSRLAVPPPLGGWDRDISTSEELLQYATAYDLLLGAGYDFGAAAPLIEERIADLASELYENFAHPETANNFALLHQNNHRAKSGAALVIAALAVAEYAAPPGGDPRQVRDAARWLAYGLDQADLIMRYGLVTGDGAYAEGPFYFRYASQNLLPFWRAWDRLVDGGSWLVEGIEVPSYWRHPLLARSLRWALDMTLPDGSLAPVDDGNPYRCYYFGAAPSVDAAAAAWRWANCPAPFDSDGNVTLAPDAIVTYDDAHLTPAPPAGSPTAFYVEGGNAIFRSDWLASAVVAIVQAEHDTASEFGRDRDGRGLAPESHEHAEPGSFLLHAYGERLALDPGYFSFTDRGLVAKPQDHNVILVDGAGPVDYLAASTQWLNAPFGRPPADGQATLSRTLDTDGLDAARVTARYGQPAAASALIDRHVFFGADRYLVFADAVTAPAPRTYTWLLHGNGGGDSGGEFAATATGGRWTRPGASLDVGFAFDAGAPALDTTSGPHEEANGARRTHTVLRASATGAAVRGVEIAYPSPGGSAPPQLASLSVANGAGLTLRDDASDRRVVAATRSADGSELALFPPDGDHALRTDGDVVLLDVAGDGGLRLAWSAGARRLAYDGGAALACDDRGDLGLTALSPGRVEVIADCADPLVVVRGLPFVPHAADGACALSQRGEETRLLLGRERRIVLRADTDHSRPAADPGEERTVAPPQVVRLDGRGSCDADGDRLSPRWELVSAPAGSAWWLAGAETWTPQLFVDRVGPYRVRLTVSDARGDTSRPAEVLVVGGDPDEDGMDNDLDGWIDADDADGDTANRAPSVVVPLPIELGGSPLTIDLGATFSDPDGDALVFRAAVAGDALQATVAAGHLTLTPVTPGSARVIVSAADGRGGRAFAGATIEVAPPCVGDCDRDGVVSIDELTLALRAALGAGPLASCRSADADGDGRVTIDELLAAVRRALLGCQTAA
ncbi:heparinase II/III family protein [bacterium]|nr:heparinase II/III family protein [bacterium]